MVHFPVGRRSQGQTKEVNSFNSFVVAYLLWMKIICTYSLSSFYSFCLSVPSSAPSNVRLTNLQSHEVKVQWDPIPPETANGILLGYRVFYQEYWYSGMLQSMDTNSPKVHMLILRGLKSAQRYQISVAAFTSQGAGSQSYLRYITTGQLKNFFTSKSI